jgi:putative Holliday junction resolvase
MRGRRIAFDYGDVRTGVALCDPDGILASPLTILQSRDKDFLNDVVELITEHEVIHIYIGLPVHMSGIEGESVEKVRAFSQSLAERVNVPISMVDERLSTVSAQRQLKDAGVSSKDSKGLIDAMAAVAILEQGLSRENLD